MRLTELFPWFAGMFFASSVALGGDGAATETMDTGGGGGDDSATTETVSDDGASDGEIADSGSEEVGGEQGDEISEESISGKSPDGRTLPNAIKQAFAKLKEIDPKAAELARTAYYQAGDYKQAVGTVQQARDLSNLVESVGGPEGVASMQQEVQEYANELTRFANGDTQTIEELYRDFPVGAEKLTLAALDKLEASHSFAYERKMSEKISTTLRDKGVSGSINRIIELIGDGKQTAAHELATKVAQWIAGVDEFAKTKPQNEENPEAKALKEERAQLNQEKQRNFTSRVGTSVLGEINKAIDAQLVPYLKTVKLTPEQRKSLQSGIRSHLTRGFEGNQPYQQRMKGLVAQGDENAILRYVRGQLASDRVLKSIKAEWATRGFAAKPRAATNGNANAISFGSKPSSESIDWSKDPKRMRFIGDGENGEATLKSGKVIKFKH